jgi:DNA-binding MarR family transcriptional regulator
MEMSSDQALEALGQAAQAPHRLGVDNAPDDIIHQSLRLRIMAALNSLPPHEAAVEFTQLRTSVQATDGNLGAHLATLERAGYIATHKDFVGRRPRTRVTITARGRGAFGRHIAYLREVIESAQTSRETPPQASTP